MLASEPIISQNTKTSFYHLLLLKTYRALLALVDVADPLPDAEEATDDDRGLLPVLADLPAVPPIPPPPSRDPIALDLIAATS